MWLSSIAFSVSFVRRVKSVRVSWFVLRTPKLMPDEVVLSLLNYTVERLLICHLVDEVVGHPVGSFDFI